MKKNNQHGQALIELIIFLPLMFTLYSIISGFANAINGSINQQKVTRAYFYFRVQNNSTIPKPQGGPYTNWNQFGMFFVGWKDYFGAGDNPIMPCYKVTIPMSGDDAGPCEQPYSSQSTQFIRVGTVVGMCGATYTRSNAGITVNPDSLGQSFSSVVDPSSCSIR